MSNAADESVLGATEDDLQLLEFDTDEYCYEHPTKKIEDFRNFVTEVGAQWKQAFKEIEKGTDTSLPPPTAPKHKKRDPNMTDAEVEEVVGTLLTNRKYNLYRNALFKGTPWGPAHEHPMFWHYTIPKSLGGGSGFCKTGDDRCKNAQVLRALYALNLSVGPGDPYMNRQGSALAPTTRVLNPELVSIAQERADATGVVQLIPVAEGMSGQHGRDEKVLNPRDVKKDKTLAVALEASAVEFGKLAHILIIVVLNSVLAYNYLSKGGKEPVYDFAPEPKDLEAYGVDPEDAKELKSANSAFKAFSGPEEGEEGACAFVQSHPSTLGQAPSARRTTTRAIKAIYNYSTDQEYESPSCQAARERARLARPIEKILKNIEAHNPLLLYSAMLFYASDKSSAQQELERLPVEIRDVVATQVEAAPVHVGELCRISESIDALWEELKGEGGGKGEPLHDETELAYALDDVRGSNPFTKMRLLSNITGALARVKAAENKGSMVGVIFHECYKSLASFKGRGVLYESKAGAAETLRNFAAAAAVSEEGELEEDLFGAASFISQQATERTQDYDMSGHSQDLRGADYGAQYATAMVTAKYGEEDPVDLGERGLTADNSLRMNLRHSALWKHPTAKFTINKAKVDYHIFTGTDMPHREEKNPMISLVFKKLKPSNTTNESLPTFYDAAAAEKNSASESEVLQLVEGLMNIKQACSRRKSGIGSCPGKRLIGKIGDFSVKILGDVVRIQNPPPEDIEEQLHLLVAQDRTYRPTVCNACALLGKKAKKRQEHTDTVKARRIAKEENQLAEQEEEHGREGEEGSEADEE